MTARLPPRQAVQHPQRSQGAEQHGQGREEEHPQALGQGDKLRVVRAAKAQARARILASSDVEERFRGAGGTAARTEILATNA